MLSRVCLNYRHCLSHSTMDSKLKTELINRYNLAVKHFAKAVRGIRDKRSELKNLEAEVEELKKQIENDEKIRKNLADDVTFYSQLIHSEPLATSTSKESSRDEWDEWDA